MAHTAELKEVAALRLLVKKAQEADTVSAPLAKARQELDELQASTKQPMPLSEIPKVAEAIAKKQAELSILESQAEIAQASQEAAWQAANGAWPAAHNAMQNLTVALIQRSKDAAARIIYATFSPANREPYANWAHRRDMAVTTLIVGAMGGCELPDTFRPDVYATAGKDALCVLGKIDEALAIIPAATADIERLEKAADAVEKLLNA